ncbi:CPSF A subunit region-domain-containing protein [Lipomyces arxii]|uniref:CPSF A subunit region-domain-containing protein n=1 Tax=Lipomyces arxii TaxID=56418 RepID=UPI0034CD40A6
MSYSVAIHKPSSVRYSVCTDLLTPDVVSLVLARPACIDVYSIQASGLQLQFSLPVNGTITSIQSFKPSTSKVSWLFVLTEDSTCFTLAYKNGRLATEQVLNDLDDRFMPDTDTEHMAIMDPQHRGILLYINKSSLTYIPLISTKKKRSSKVISAAKDSANTISGTLYPPIKLHIEELIIVSIIFLEKVERPTIAILYRDGKHARHVKVYEIHTLDGRLEEIKGFGLRYVDQGASLLVPFATSAGGFFLLGEQLLTYFPSRDASSLSPIKIPFKGPINFCAAARIDDNGERFLLGDEFGLIYMLQVELFEDPNGQMAVNNWKITPIGETSIPTTLTYLDAGFFFVTSHFSPSSLFYLDPEEPHVQSVQVIPNLAPITDFQIIPRESATDVIACSGAFKSGSLRIVRSGVGVDILAEIGGISGITNLWTLDDDVIIASFVENTLVFQGNPEEGTFEELIGWNNVNPNEPTIEVASSGSKLVHISRSQVKLIDATSSTVLATYQGNLISNATTTSEFIILATAEKTLVQLSWDLEVLSNVVMSNEISCLTAVDDLCFAGLWNECTIALLTLPQLSQIGTTATLSGNILRSLRVANFAGIDNPLLYAGMADGTLHSFSIGPNTALDGELSDQKATVLGTQPISLYTLSNSLLAVCSHPVMIYGHTNKVTISSVNIESPTAVAVCKSSMANEDDATEILVFAMEDKISYGVIDQLMSTHVQTLKLEETARRLTVMSQEAGVYGLIALKTELDAYTGDETLNCSVKIVDSALFEVVDSYELEFDEMAESIASGFFDGMEYLIVGTGYVSGDREEYTKGRILVFEVTRDKRLSLLLTSERYGGVYAMQITNEHLVCAINSIVHLFELETNALSGSLELRESGMFRSATMAITLSAYDDYVLVGDLMKSAALLRITSATNDVTVKYEFEEISRHFEPMWMTDVEILDEDISLGSEAEGNMVVFQRENVAPAEMIERTHSVGRSEESKLQVVSSTRIGEVVNRIRRIPRSNDDVSATESIVIPQAYYATRDGGIYLYGKILPEHINTLINLQTNMSKIVKSAGNLKIMTFRAFANQRRKLQEPVRFVDGDYLELYLELSESEKEAVVTGQQGGIKLGYSVNQITSIIEDLKRLH